MSFIPGITYLKISTFFPFFKETFLIFTRRMKVKYKAEIDTGAAKEQIITFELYGTHLSIKGMKRYLKAGG